MRIIFIMVLSLLCGAGQGMAKDVNSSIKDDGGFGATRFSSQVPAALGGDVAPSNNVAVVPSATPANIEPAAGEEDITPEEETLDNGQVSEKESDIR